MYSNNERIDGENKNTWRLGEATMNYYRKLAENREAADAAFEEYMSNQKLAAIGASIQLNKMQSEKVPGSPACAENCSCGFCQRTAELSAIAARGATVAASAQKVASANDSSNLSSAPVHRQPKWKLR